MGIQKITFKNYKSFEQEQVFEIKPITLVIGKNNSGKTALIQLPLMLNAWMEDRNGMLSLSANGIKFAKQMKELIFNHSKDKILEISFVLSSEIEGIVKIQLLEDDYTISYLEWKYRDNIVWKAEKKGNKYEIFADEPEKEGWGASLSIVPSLSRILSGILPGAELILAEEEAIHVDEAGNEIPYIASHYTLRSATMMKVQYFAGLRHSFIDASFSFDDEKYKARDSKGEFAVHYLYHHSDVLEDVKNWYIENMDGWGIGLKKDVEIKNMYLYLEDFSKSNGQKTPITQTGQGITQALPLVTTALTLQNIAQHGWDNDMFQIPDIIIEQPELHIHPAAHGNLVELFAESALKSGNNYILETHSEVMLLRVRRLVAEGKLKPEQVAIYWVDSEEGREGKRSFLKKIEVDEFGMLDDWPEDVFAEDHEEVLAIRRAQRRKEEMK